MKSLGELAMIESISWYERQLLCCFVYAGEVKRRSFPSFSQIAKYGKHEMVAAVKVPLYERKETRMGIGVILISIGCVISFIIVTM